MPGVLSVQPENPTSTTSNKGLEALKAFSVSSEGLELSKPRYKEMFSISRTVHYDSFVTVMKLKEFQASRINKGYKTLLPKKGKFVFFRAEVEDTKPKNDWFGNLKFSVDLLTILKNDPSIKMFSVDYARFGCSSVSRILLTRRNSFSDFQEITLPKLIEGNPIIYKEDKLWFADKVKNSFRKAKWRHSVEFVFDVETISSSWLLSQCQVKSVDHSHANGKEADGKYGKHQCLLYNSRAKACPSPWTYEETDAKLQKLGKNRPV